MACLRGLAAFTVLAPTLASAVPISGTIPNLDPPANVLTVTVDVDFAFDAGCTVDCQLHITLANITTGALTTIGQTLSGLTFEPDSPITIDRTLSSVLVDTTAGDRLVGAASGTATNDLKTNGHIDVSRHWAFNLLLEPVMEAGGSRMLGSYVVGSVGDVANGTPVFGNVGLLGVDDRLGDPNLDPISSIETNAPNGTTFSIVNDATCSPNTCGNLKGGFQNEQGRAWIQNGVWISLHYDGQLASISKVEPLFGTDGNSMFVVPEPGLGLLVLGLGGLVLTRRRGSR
jgi:hypothetical protein